MARLSNEMLRSPAYVDRLLTEAEDSLTRAQNSTFDILADANSAAEPAEFQMLVTKAKALGDKANSLARILEALNAQVTRIADLKAQLASKGEGKPVGKGAKMAAAAE